MDVTTDNVKSQVGQLQANLAKLNQNLGGLKLNFAEQAKQNSTTPSPPATPAPAANNEELLALKTQLQTIQSEKAKIYETQEKEKEELKNRIDSLERALKEGQETQQQKQLEQEKQLKAKMEALEKELNAAQQQKTDLSTQIIKSKQDLQSNEQKLAAQIAEMQKGIDDERKQKQAQDKKQQDNLSVRLAEMERELKRVQETNDKLKKEVETGMLEQQKKGTEDKLTETIRKDAEKAAAAPVPPPAILQGVTPASSTAPKLTETISMNNSNSLYKVSIDAVETTSNSASKSNLLIEETIEDPKAPVAKKVKKDTTVQKTIIPEDEFGLSFAIQPFKVLLIGNTGVGKTCLFQRIVEEPLMDEKYLRSTPEVYYQVRPVEVDRHYLRLQVVCVFYIFNFFF